MSTDPNAPTPGTPDPGTPAPAPGAAFPAGAQAEGSAANVAADAERDTAEQALSDGSLDLAGLFQQGATPGAVGHMHVKAALIALPHIDQVKADRILADTGIDGTHHIDQLGSQQQQALIDAVANA